MFRIEWILADFSILNDLFITELEFCVQIVCCKRSYFFDNIEIADDDCTAKQDIKHSLSRLSEI